MGLTHNPTACRPGPREAPCPRHPGSARGTSPTSSWVRAKRGRRSRTQDPRQSRHGRSGRSGVWILGSALRACRLRRPQDDEWASGGARMSWSLRATRPVVLGSCEALCPRHPGSARSTSPTSSWVRAKRGRRSRTQDPRQSRHGRSGRCGVWILGSALRACRLRRPQDDRKLCAHPARSSQVRAGHFAYVILGPRSGRRSAGPRIDTRAVGAPTGDVPDVDSGFAAAPRPRMTSNAATPPVIRVRA